MVLGQVAALLLVEPVVEVLAGLRVLVLLARLILVGVVEVLVALVLLVAQAAPVSLSSKSHLRTMPHSHLV